MSNMQRYCNMLQNFDTFNTSNKALLLVFGVPYAKYLAFSTFATYALTHTRYLEPVW